MAGGILRPPQPGRRRDLRRPVVASSTEVTIPPTWLLVDGQNDITVTTADG
jgi:hypothetical protein